MRVLTNGNVGIGTTTPGAKLSFGLSHNTGFNQFNDPIFGVRNDILSIYENGSDKYGLGIHGGTLDMYAPDNMGLLFGHRSTAGNLTSRMFIQGNGNVGIGTSTPSDKLQVIGGVTATAFTTASDSRFKQ